MSGAKERSTAPVGRVAHKLLLQLMLFSVCISSMSVCTFSCGNQMFSVFPNGNIRWKSKFFGNNPNPWEIPVTVAITPSLHPDDRVYFINSNHTTLFALATKDGSLVKSFNITHQDFYYVQLPIVVGKKFLYLLRFSIDGFPYYGPMLLEVLPFKL